MKTIINILIFVPPIVLIFLLKKYKDILDKYRETVKVLETASLMVKELKTALQEVRDDLNRRDKK